MAQISSVYGYGLLYSKLVGVPLPVFLFIVKRYFEPLTPS